MKETSKYLYDYYNNENEDKRLASKHGSVEFLTTMRYIKKYLKTGDKILEIGAATGRYSHAIACKGYEVDAVELVESNIEIFHKNTQSGEKITITQGNALDLSCFADNTYDITLLFGPMYHLYTKEDKQQALREAIRVTKHGGVIFVAYCMSDPSILMMGFKHKDLDLLDFIDKGFINAETFETRSTPELIFDLVRKEQIDALMNDFNVERLHFIAVDLYTNHMSDEIDQMDDERFSLYMRYHFAICERPDMMGLSHHTLDVFRKI